MTALAYCPSCRKMVPFTTERVTTATELDGAVYSYEADQARCAVCGAEAVYEPYREAAALAFGDAVRTAKGIVTLAVVRDLPRKYHIGKRPLSRLLGWGELTYTRFIEGHVPSRQYSDCIQGLYDNPLAYQRLLRANKDLVSPRSFEQSMRAVQKVIRNDFPDSERLLEVGNAFCALSDGNVGAMELQKLTYYAQGFSMVLCRAPLFTTLPRAWAAGPVYGQLWKEFGAAQQDESEGNGLVDFTEDNCFTEVEEIVIRAVWRAFGGYSGTVLSKITHREDPWRLARERAGVQEGQRSSEVIRLEDMKAYFEKVLAPAQVDEQFEKAIAEYARMQAAAVMD